MKKMKWLLFIVAVLLIIWISGPSPQKPLYSTAMPEVPAYVDLDSFIASQESAHRIKSDNEARIEWYDSSHQPTEYAIVYLHGFSASHEEGAPVHRDMAKRFGCNLYLSRLSQHGIDTSEQLMNLTADNYWESAKQALAIGEKIGKKVILMGVSTGATQAIQLAAAFPDDVAGLILYSPNIAINDPNAWLLNDHWGLQIARLVKKSNYNDPADPRPVYKKYWNKPYRLESLVALQEMLETSMTPEVFKKVKQPVLMLYYYKDEAHQDPVVKVSSMKEMFEQLGTPAEQKVQKAMPNTGDHVIASPIKSKDVDGVEKETINFLKQIMGLKEIFTITLQPDQGFFF